MNGTRLTWLVLAVLAGFIVAVICFRRAYGRRPAVVYSNVPPSARPRYIVYGDYYDPYAIWPYGAGSSYGLVAASNGAPSSIVPGGAGRSPSTGPGNGIYGGGGGGIAAGASLGGGFRGG